MDGEEDAVLTDDDVPTPSFECRVPSEWQAVMSTRALRQAAAAPLPEVVTSCSLALQRVISVQTANPPPEGHSTAPQMDISS